MSASQFRPLAPPSNPSTGDNSVSGNRRSQARERWLEQVAQGAAGLAAASLSAAAQAPTTEVGAQETPTITALREQADHCLQGLDGLAVNQLRASVRSACTLQDFWHLRSAIFTELAHVHGQAEAVRRLDRLHELLEPPGLRQQLRALMQLN